MIKGPKKTLAFDMRTIAIAISAVITLTVGGISAAYFIGYSVKDMEARQKQIDDLRHLIEENHSAEVELVKQEVGGLRADWDRDREAQDKRLEKLEK